MASRLPNKGDKLSLSPLLGTSCLGAARLGQWRHQDLKSGGGARRGQRLIMGGGQTCARSAHSERVSASRFWVGFRGPP